MTVFDMHKIPIATSLGLVAGIPARPVLASLIIQKATSRIKYHRGVIHSWGAKRCRRPLHQVTSICLALVFAVLVAVKLASIRTGPSADEAIAAIRVAQRELFEAKWVYREPTPRAVNHAENMLDVALSALDEKRYEEAIWLAYRTTELVKQLGG